MQAKNGGTLREAGIQDMGIWIQVYTRMTRGQGFTVKRTILNVITWTPYLGEFWTWMIRERTNEICCQFGQRMFNLAAAPGKKKKTTIQIALFKS